MQNVTEDRNKYIGGSDIPVIMGISPFKKRYDLLLEKAGLQENEFNGNEYTEYGNVLEPKIRDYVNQGLEHKFYEDKLINEDIRCHVDGFNGTSIVEIKTTSQIHHSVDEYKVYLVQLLFYMSQYNVNNGILLVYERPKDFNEEFDENRLQVFKVNINDYQDLVEKIYQEVDRFRYDLQMIKDNPLICEEDLLPKELVEVSNEIIKYEKMLVEMKNIEKTCKTLKSTLFKAMCEHNIKKWTTINNVQITRVDGYKQETITTEVFDLEALKNEHPDLFTKYMKTETKIKKATEGYVKITLPKK